VDLVNLDTENLLCISTVKDIRIKDVQETEQTPPSPVGKVSESPEIFITDDNITQTQDSQNERDAFQVEEIPT
jgi:hypothetical protein